MVKKQRLAAIAGAIILVAIWYWMSRPTPEKRVRRKLTSLSHVITKKEKEPNSQMMLKMQQLEHLMADPVTINTGRHGLLGVHSSAELVSLATRIRGMMTSVDLDFHDIEVVELTEDAATLACTSRFLLRTGEQGVEETAEMRIHLQRLDGTWRFTDFQEIEVMKK